MNKPEIRVKKTIDFLDVLNWCEQYRQGIKDRVWDYHIDDISNDIIVWLNFSDDEDEYRFEKYGNDILNKDFEFIRNEFPDVEDVLFDISW